MRLLKIIVVLFLIYFIRRFIQMYRAMKSIQEQQNNRPPRQGPSGPQKSKSTIDADFKVID